jgi:hypothetical protein
MRSDFSTRVIRPEGHAANGLPFVLELPPAVLRAKGPESPASLGPKKSGAFPSPMLREFDEDAL